MGQLAPPLNSSWQARQASPATVAHSDRGEDARNMSEPIKRLMAMIAGLAAAGFYGTVTAKFEGGKITTIKKEETIKLG